MLKRDDHICLGYSGGKDSTVLLYILYNLKKRFPHCNMTAITVDEGIQEKVRKVVATMEKY